MATNIFTWRRQFGVLFDDLSIKKNTDAPENTNKRSGTSESGRAFLTFGPAKIFFSQTAVSDDRSDSSVYQI